MSVTRFLRHACLSALGVGSIAAISAGCLDRPVAPATPKTTARVTDRVRQTAVDKIDLLFMLDNSISMADKQLVLAKAVPDLVSRLVDPDCVEIVGDEEKPVEKNSDGTCPDGSQREFEPVKDIHIGVISSSIGANGADQCTPDTAGFNPTMQDMAHLLSRGENVSTYENKGFLQWDPASEKSPPGTADQDALSATFTNMVVGVGQNGCGYEQSLEAVYRFLVDPDPYKQIQLIDEEGRSGQTAYLGPPEEKDETLLQQRADFLRPDSLVAIVSLSDENDCSTIAGDRWYMALDSRYAPPRGTSACAEDPNSECCGPCRGWQAPAGCTPVGEDPTCQINEGKYTIGQGGEVGANLRCFDQKRRFGVEYLYPVERYVDAIQQRVVPNRQGEMVQNPLFADLQCNGENCKPERDDSFVFWAMIVGVPWQDIAKVDENGLPNLSLGYMTTSEMAEQDIDRWDVILGDPQASPPVRPLDPLMIESVEQRSGQHPITADPIVPTGSPAPGLDANSINGHERVISDGDDLQYACIFRLENPVECGPGVPGCDCTAESATNQDPLCQNPDGNGFGLTQYSAKAYPGTRHLQVAQKLGEQAIVASICPANLQDAAAPDFGYRPAIGALIDRLKTRLRGRCLPRILEPNVCDVEKDDPTYGQVPCVILEAQSIPEGQACGCTEAGRGVPNDMVVTDDVREAGNCICEITQLEGQGLQDCETQPDETKVNADGWCYVDPGQGIGSDELVLQCLPTEKRIIRFVNKGNPANNSTIFITCQEGAFNPAASGDAGDGDNADHCARL